MFKCNANSVIFCLKQLLTLFGTPAFVHSDRGPTLYRKNITRFCLIVVLLAVKLQFTMRKVMANVNAVTVLFGIRLNLH